MTPGSQIGRQRAKLVRGKQDGLIREDDIHSEGALVAASSRVSMLT